jgi:integrase
LVSDWTFWAPLIAYFTGLRVGEIAQLRPQDVTQRGEGDDRRWFLSVNNDEGKRTKTERDRLTPIHPELIRLGLLRLAQSRAAAGERDLLPGCPAPVGGEPGKQLSKWFSEKFLPHVTRKGHGQGFHAFRHRLVEELKAAEVDTAVASLVVGHGGGTTTERYGQRGWLVAMAKAVETKVVAPEVIKRIPSR